MRLVRASRRTLWRWQPEIEFLLLVVGAFALIGFYELALHGGAPAFERAIVRMVPGASPGTPETWNLVE